MKPQATPSCVDPLAAWRADHRAFNRLLDLLESEVAVFHVGEQPNYALMLDILTYLHEYLGDSHHPREGVAFARLLSHDPRLRAQVGQRSEEHRIIEEQEQRLIRLLNEVIDGDLIPRVELERAAASYLLFYRHHLTAEDQFIVPRAARLLTADDWNAVAAAAPMAEDPLAAGALDGRYQELRRALARRETAALDSR
ncbi:MAG TPA: hemerythrin domain-containing protein [Burkholderiaceae bacterium]|nr:hemerythrin domain-containing protein [Burkholderiaceae bacterium]